MPIYMQFEGIKGDVTVPGYIGWIELSSAQLGQTRSQAVPISGRGGSGSGRQPSTPNISDIAVTKVQDTSSAGLFRQAAVGQGRKVVIAFTKSGGTGEAPYMKIELENLLISSFIVSGGPDGKPMESLSLNFTKITYIQGSQQQLQNAQPAYDLATAKGG